MSTMTTTPVIHPREQLISAIEEAKANTAANKAKAGKLIFGHRPRRTFHNTAGWFEIDGQRIYAKSKWERNYARHLAFMRQNGHITEWRYEPETFWFEGIKRGVNNYKPDFKVTWKNDSIEYIEVKGYMDSKSKTKIKRMAKYHPKIKLTVLAEGWWKTAGKEVGKYVPEWE